MDEGGICKLTKGAVDKEIVHKKRHFHYVLSMGASFALFGGYYYWVEKITGRRYDQLLGAVQFWTLFIGVKTFAHTSLDAGKSKMGYFIRIARPSKAIVTPHQWAETHEEKEVTHLMEKNNRLRLSAGVCEKSTAPQRINAKELIYLLGLLEADGSIFCYLEKSRKGKVYWRGEVTVGLEESDIKLCYYIRKILGCGTVRKHSIEKERWISRYQLRSKKLIMEKIIKGYEEYPALTENKRMRVEWFKKCYEEGRLVEKPEKEKREVRDEKYIRDWIIGFIEGDGSFYITKGGVVGFNVTIKGEERVMERIREVMGIKRKLEKRESGIIVLTAESREDIQRVVDFMTSRERVRLKGLKKVRFILWLRYLRRTDSKRYGGLRIPDRY